MAKAEKSQTAKFGNAEIRNVDVRRRNGADGPEQYARLVLHVELKGKSDLQQAFTAQEIAKGTVGLELYPVQPDLPGVEGGPKEK